MRARLTVESGAASPAVFEMDDTAVVLLGRNRDNTIVLQDRHASRSHARIYAAGGRWFIRDQETTNGTRVDDAPVRDDAPLRDGQLIAIGDVRLRFALLGGEAAEVTPPPTPRPDVGDTTLLAGDEMTALFHFLNEALGDAPPQRQVALALEAALRHTGADLAGYLSLDA